MTDHEFLTWLGDRLVHVYGESPNVDFVLRLRKIADASTEVAAAFPLSSNSCPHIARATWDDGRITCDDCGREFK